MKRSKLNLHESGQLWTTGNNRTQFLFANCFVGLMLNAEERMLSTKSVKRCDEMELIQSPTSTGQV
ncbi:hypothetical protein WJ36_02840 [Burkholderia ubonensis]|nr:hypothetical protein WJ36_02840 [Burkholderia ubonensis]